MLTFPKHENYRDSGLEWLGKIPSRWSLQSIRSVTDLKSERNRPDLPVLSVYREYGVLLKDSRDDNHNATSLDISNYKVVEVGDLVVNKMKAWQGSMGISEHQGIVSPAYITCQVDASKIFPNFLHYLLRSQPYIGVYNALSYGVRIGQWDMHYEDFKKIPLPIPDVEEQRRIAEFLDRKTSEIDQAIAQKQRLIELLQEQKAILINQAVTKGLNPNAPMRDSGFEWIGEIPKHWNVSRIGFIGKVGNGSTPNRSNLAYWNNGSIPWLNSSKVNDVLIYSADQFVTDKAVRECHLPIVKPDSIVLAITGEGKTRGTAAICKIETTINQHLAYIEILDKHLPPEFLLLYLQAMYGWMRFESSGNGSTKGAITCDDIKKYKVPIPPLDEQKQILEGVSERLSNLGEVIKRTWEAIEKLNYLKQVFISNAVTGKMKV